MIKRLFYIVIILFVTLVGVGFAVRNAHEVTFNYYMGSIDLPLSVIMVASFAVGVLLATLAATFAIMKLRLKLSSSKRKYRKLEDSYAKKVKALDVCNLEAKRIKATSNDTQNALPETVD